jgi:hypothetical protein
MHAICESRKTPAAVYEKKCEGCSMKPVCLPSVAGCDRASRYLRRSVANNLRQCANPAAMPAEEEAQ